MSPIALALAALLALPPRPAAPASGACGEAASRSPPLGAWCSALAARPRLPGADPADREALRDVLERPELRRVRVDTTGLRRLVAGLWARLLDLLGSSEAEQYASMGRTIFLAAALAGTLAALAALRRRRVPAAPRAASAPALAGALPPADESAALAEGALGRGDWAEALRRAFLSALGALEEAGRLPRDRSLTNRELATRVPDARLAADFGILGRTFDEAVYGGAPVDEPRARRGLELAARIRAGAGGGA